MSEYSEAAAKGFLRLAHSIVADSRVDSGFRATLADAIVIIEDQADEIDRICQQLDSTEYAFEDAQEQITCLLKSADFTRQDSERERRRSEGDAYALARQREQALDELKRAQLRHDDRGAQRAQRRLEELI